MIIKDLIIISNNNTIINFTLNGKQINREIPSSLLLIDLIRDDLGLKGTKPGCLEGECGACTVLINGSPVCSCLYLAINANGKEVVTIEGLYGIGPDGGLDPVQEAMIANGAVQCGFCTSGLVMSIKSFQSECEQNNIIPDREQIKVGLEGNLCRCTGYVKVINAVESLFVEAK